MANRYNFGSVQSAIDKDKNISKAESTLIHALLKGWRASVRLHVGGDFDALNINIQGID